MLDAFRDRLEGYFAPSSGRVNTSGGYWSAGNLRTSTFDLSKQKSELGSQEQRAEKAALSTETEARLL